MVRGEVFGCHPPRRAPRWALQRRSGLIPQHQAPRGCCFFGLGLLQLISGSADERTRADMFKRDFEWHLDLLLGLDLSRAGVSQVSQAYAGGISKSDKSTVEADTDRMTPRFSRGMYDNAEALRPGPSSAS